MTKKFKNPFSLDAYAASSPAPPAGSTTKEYCWRFLHPKHGWCGGGDDDRWTEKKTEVETAMLHCPYESEILTRDA